jgi:hypothetical protein
MADLITQDYYTQSMAAAGLTVPAAALVVLPQVISAASRAVRKFCNRTFSRTIFDELYTQTAPGNPILLKQYPVNAVLRVATGPRPVLSISNSDTATNQRATVSLATTGSTDVGLVVTGLALTRVASGVAIAPSFAFTTYPTVQALADAINAAGGGWVATPASGYELWATADFKPSTSALPALGTVSADLIAWTEDVPAEIDLDAGIVRMQAQDDDPFTSYKFGPYLATDFGDTRITGALDGVRIISDAGFDTVPEDVQQATVLTVKAMLDKPRLDFARAAEKWDGYGYSRADGPLVAMIPPEAKDVLGMYRNHRA